MTITLTKAQRQLRIKNGEALARVMREILLRDAINDRIKEHFWVVGLAADHTLQYVELVSLGSRRATVVEPMEIFRWALQKDSASIILVHNHPRGTLLPSEQDVDLTIHMYQVGELLELPVLDHLIISTTGHYSFLDDGLMAGIAKRKKVLLDAAAQERLKAEAAAVAKVEGEKVGEARGREAEKLQVALALKAEGIEATVIAKVTGLSAVKVKGLKAPKPRS